MYSKGVSLLVYELGQALGRGQFFPYDQMLCNCDLVSPSNAKKQIRQA